MKKIIAIASLCGLASTVSAQSAFEGAFGQIGIGYESTSTKVTGAEAAAGVSVGNSNSLTGNVSAGYYFGLTKTFLLGLGADYSPLASQKSNLTINGVVFGNQKKTNSYNIFVSPAIALDKNKLAYAKLGYTGASTVQEIPGVFSQTINYRGYSLGLGYKQMFTNGLYGFAEGNYAMYGKRNIENNGGAYQLSGMNFLVGVGYKF